MISGNMRFSYTLLVMVIILAFAIGLTLRGEKINLDTWSRQKASFQWEYVDDSINVYPSVVEINFFEEQNDIYNLFVVSKKSSVQRSTEYRTQGAYSAQVIFGSDWEELVLFYFSEEWSKYKYLRLDIYNPKENSLNLELRVGDFFDCHGWYPDSQKFKRQLQLKQGWNNLSFSLEDIAKQIDLSSLRKTIHLSFSSLPDDTIYIDNARLEKE